MTQSWTVLNKAIDESIGRLIVKQGSEGFTYQDVEMRVRSALGNELQVTLVELGQVQLRDRIRRRATSMIKGQVDGLADLHPKLFEEDASIVYPVKGHDGQTVFKQVAHLNKDDFDDIIRDLIKQRKGLDRHLRALRKIERRLKNIWNKHPEWDVETAQQFLDPEAA
jgi:hypothetical protein